MRLIENNCIKNKDIYLAESIIEQNQEVIKQKRDDYFKKQDMELAVKKVWFDKQKIFALLNDERIAGMPLSQFPRLLKAPKELREKYGLWRNGKWIHWEELNEDLSLDGFLDPSEICPLIYATLSLLA